MADEVDVANDYQNSVVEKQVKEITSKPMAPGVPGECDLCGEWSGRLVKGACAPCRDKYKLP